MHTYIQKSRITDVLDTFQVTAILLQLVNDCLLLKKPQWGKAFTGPKVFHQPGLGQVFVFPGRKEAAKIPTAWWVEKLIHCTSSCTPPPPPETSLLPGRIIQFPRALGRPLVSQGHCVPYFLLQKRHYPRRLAQVSKNKVELDKEDIPHQRAVFDLADLDFLALMTKPGIWGWRPDSCAVDDAVADARRASHSATMPLQNRLCIRQVHVLWTGLPWTKANACSCDGCQTSHAIGWVDIKEEAWFSAQWAALNWRAASWRRRSTLARTWTREKARRQRNHPIVSA